MLLSVWIALTFYEAHRRLPPGLHLHGAWAPLPAASPAFLDDLTAADANGAPLRERQIDDELLRLIGQARELLVLDAGLFGDLPAAGPGSSRLRPAAPLAARLIDALVQARRDHPDLEALVLVDPSSFRLAADDAPFARLRGAGIAVVGTDIARLRPPNPLFAALWRLCCAWLPVHAGGDWPNPAGVGPHDVSMGLWGELRWTPRSHRQVLIADDGQRQLVGLVFSRPLHAEAALHSATALRLTGAALAPLLESELVVAQFSGWGGPLQARAQHLAAAQAPAAAPALAAEPASAPGGGARARVVTEGAIGETLVRRIEAARSGQSIDIAALVVSQRDLVRALIDAARRGVRVRVLLDPGRAAYGFERNGLPNREVASELVAASDGGVRVRWYRTHGELFSPGLALIRDAERSWLLVGTGELSGPDLDDCNLAAALVVDLPAGAVAGTDALRWFDTLWFNRAAGGIEYTSDADVYADASQLRYWQYRILEASGADYD